MIRIICPHCGKTLEIPDSFAGQQGKCKCGELVLVPIPAPLPVVPQVDVCAQIQARMDAADRDKANRKQPAPLDSEFKPGMGKTQKGCLGCFGLFVAFMVLGAIGNAINPQHRTTLVQPPQTTQNNLATTVPAARQPAKFSDQQTSYSRTGEIRDVSTGCAKRLVLCVVVPLGRTREQLTATLDRAARELEKETQAKAVMVAAYRPQDSPTDTYTAGKAVYAPNGQWEDACTSAPMRVSVDLNDLYFAPPKDKIAVGEVVQLKASLGGAIKLSKGPDRWFDEDMIASVPVGTDATIIERRVTPMSNLEFVRYCVRVTSNGSDVTGWVHQSNVEGESGKATNK
jgi:hypothetical protein